MLSYLAKADLAVRGSDTYATTMANFAESSYEVTMGILNPAIEFVGSMFGYEPSKVLVKENSEALERACDKFVKTHSSCKM